MNTWERFEAICSAMADPAFYAHSAADIRRQDTHISAVFLTGKWAYKLKKPVNLGFLDFRTLARRRLFCENEVRLNKRLSQGIYDKVISVYESKTGKFSLEENGRVAEYAVRMKQLPDQTTLGNLLKANAISQVHMEHLGNLLAAFYKKSEQNPAINDYGSRKIIAFNTEENFRQARSHAGRLFDAEKWQFICEVSRTFLDHHQALFNRRVETGRIRDGHGDLRTDHIYFHDGVQVIDCIEFNDRFRYGDVASDLAFLHMDMDHLGASQWSRELLKVYVRKARDPEIYSLIDFYAAYRAIVRLKVACFRYQTVTEADEQKALKEEIGGYLTLAYRYTLQFSRPTLWVFCGLPASGKSCLAERLARLLPAKLFQSDAIRKEKQPSPEIVPFGTGEYSAARRQRVYARLLALAQDELRRGRSVILDATYSKRNRRGEVRQLARDLDTNLIFAECACSAETLSARLRDRETASGLSDARLCHLQDMMADFEPLSEIAPETHVKVSTEQPTNDAFLDLLSDSYAGKTEQVKQRL